MLKNFFITLFVLLLTSSLSYALDDQGNINDPTVNDRANACYEDGSMANKCDTQIEWDAGWYLIRFEFGLLSRDEFPDWVIWVLPPEVLPEDLLAVVPPTTCNIYAAGNFLTTYGATVTISLDIVTGNNSGVFLDADDAYWSTNGLGYGALGWPLYLFGSWHAGNVGSTDCPTPTAP